MEILAAQTALASLIEKFEANTLKAGRANFNAGFLRSRRECLERYWITFGENHKRLLEIETLVDNEYFNEDRFSAVELIYTQALGMLYEEEAKMRAATVALAPANMPVGPHPSRAILPKISLPTFNGRHENWESFRDMFRSLIHEDLALTGVQKLHYLKTSVQGEAGKALESVATTEVNYMVAWNLLCTRYDNKQLWAYRHMNALTAISPLKFESSSGLQTLLDQIKGKRESLSALGKPVAEWGDWFVLFAAKGMDPITRREWEKELRKEAQTSMYDHLISFLENTVQTLKTLDLAGNQGDASRNVKPIPTSRPPARVLTTSLGKASCPSCRSSMHYIGHCKPFERSTMEERKRIVSRAQLCFNCLKPDHRANACPSQNTCQTCGRRHHTLLHGSEAVKRKRTSDDQAELWKQKRPRLECESSKSEQPSAMP